MKDGNYILMKWNGSMSGSFIQLIFEFYNPIRSNLCDK